ncbi:S-adenosyl-L-methionine-dependent methyltransferase [Mycena sp. CBHHK59/15]|nr:S-adenosyl-L-methionine-dependent methyltransferase [Mycena sp. CBHHK59/15]
MPVAVPPDDDPDTASDEGSDSEPESYFPGAEENDDEFEELLPEDFPTYFSERDGRLFHSHGTSPYPLPVDTPEQERMNIQHRALLQLLGAHYPTSCPVPDVLALSPGRQKYALDLCTGTGKWTMDMARAFPHVAFRAIDIVPIATRYPLANVQFTMHDVNTRTVWDAGTFDLIHARSVSMAVTSYAATLAEVARLLRPRGLFLSGEWSRAPAFHPSFAPRTPATHAPALTAFFALLYATLTARGLLPVPPRVPALLAASGGFADIAQQDYCMPVGPWHPDPALQQLGLVFRVVVLRYFASVRPMLAEGGAIPPTELERVYQCVRRELRTVEGLVFVFRTVHARRV